MTYQTHYAPDEQQEPQKVGGRSFVFTGSYSGSYRPMAQPKRLHLRFQLKWIPNAGFVGDIVAERFGSLWDDISLDLLPAEPGRDPISLVMAGRAPFGVCTGDQFLLAVKKGHPIVALGVAYQINPLAWVSRGADPADLTTGLVGLTGVDDAHLLDALLRRKGSSLAAAKARTTRVSGVDFSRFWDGEVRSYPVYRNTQGVELERIATKIGAELRFLSAGDDGIQAYSNLYFTTREFLEQHDEIVGRFIALVMRGWHFARSDPARAAELVASHSITIDRDLVRTAVEKTLELAWPADRSLDYFGQMHPEVWDSTQDTLVKAGLLERPIDISDATTNAYLERASDLFAA